MRKSSSNVRTLNAVKAAVPPAPAGWTLEDRNRISPPGSVCTGSAVLPIRASYDVRYYSPAIIEELDQKNKEFRKRIADLKQLPAEKQAEYDASSRQGRDLEREARKLMATDKEQAEKMMAESRELSKAAHAIRQAHLQSIAPQIDAISKEQYDATGNVPVEYSSPNKTLIAYGPWTRKGKAYQPVYTAGSTTRIANVSIEMIGDHAQAAQILPGMKADSLSSLITP